MRRSIRLIALITLLATMFSLLCSCELVDNILNKGDNPPSVTPGGTSKPQDNTKPEDNNKPSDSETPDDPEKPEDPNDPETPLEPEKPKQTTEPDGLLSPEEEAELARYGYMPHLSNGMAAIYINTEDGSNSWVTKYNQNDKIAGNIDYEKATISVDNCEEEYEMTDVSAEVKVRGNATLNYEKKPIRIKFTKKQNLLGLHDGEKYKNWVLLADYKDLSMSNNTAAFFLGNLILGSDGYYCTDFRNVEVYLNGEYWGVYLLVEQQEVKDGRTSTSEVEDDYTGTDIGYFFEYDGYYTQEGTSYLDGGEGDPTFTMSYPSGATHRGGIGYTVKSDLYTKDQLNFLKRYLENAFTIAYQATKGKYYKFDENYNLVYDTSATNAKDVIASVIDIQSLVDVYILNEIACDLDVDWSSFYLSLDMSSAGNKKVTFEAPWDWDSCFGLRFDIDSAVPNAQGMYASKRNNPWIRLVTGEEWFWDMVREKWSEMKTYDVLDRTINLIRDQKVMYAQDYLDNNKRWPGRVTGGNGECNSTLDSFRDINTAQSLASDYLIDWLNKRFTYLDSQWLIEGDRAYGEKEVISTVTPPAGTSAYRIEAEEAILTDFKSETPVRYNRLFASGGAYVSDMHEGSTLTFTFNIEKTSTIYIYISVAKRADSYAFDDCFEVLVNGKKLSMPAREIPAIEEGERQWHSFACIRLSTVLVGQGENTITVTAVTDTTNIDYIEIYSPVGVN